MSGSGESDSSPEPDIPPFFSLPTASASSPAPDVKKAAALHLIRSSKRSTPKQTDGVACFLLKL